MAVARKTHVVASSKENFQEAVNTAVSRAAKTLRGITGVEVLEMKGKVQNDKIIEYRVECAITFILEE